MNDGAFLKLWDHAQSGYVTIERLAIERATGGELESFASLFGLTRHRDRKIGSYAPDYEDDSALRGRILAAYREAAAKCTKPVEPTPSVEREMKDRLMAMGYLIEHVTRNPEANSITAYFTTPSGKVQSATIGMVQGENMTDHVERMAKRLGQRGAVAVNGRLREYEDGEPVLSQMASRRPKTITFSGTISGKVSSRVATIDWDPSRKPETITEAMTHVDPWEVLRKENERMRAEWQRLRDEAAQFKRERDNALEMAAMMADAAQPIRDRVTVLENESNRYRIRAEDAERKVKRLEGKK